MRSIVAASSITLSRNYVASARLPRRAPGPTTTSPKTSSRSLASSRRTIAPKRSKAGIMTLWKRPCASLARRPSWIWKGSAATTFGTLARDEVLARRDRAKEELNSFIAACETDLAALLHEELRPAVAGYEHLKAKTGVLDFLDLLIKARDLIRENDAVRVELQNRFTHFFVDEFQDTDPLQAEILLLLCADDTEENDWSRVHPIPGKLFVVGDPKQSIYRFRRADVAIYEAVKRSVTAAGAELLHLTKSFRAPPSLQSFVNAAFAAAMEAAPDGSQAAYVALEKARPEIAGRPTVIALPVPRPYSDRGRINTNRQIEASYPEAVGAFLHWLLNESGWTIEEERNLVRVAAAACLCPLP